MSLVHRSLVFLLLAGVLAAQDRDAITDLIGGSEEDRLCALLVLEEVRNGDPGLWGSLLERAADAPSRARVLRALGRIGDPRLVPIVRDFLKADEAPLAPEVARAAALAVGLLKDPRLLYPLSDRGDAAALALALGLIGREPAALQMVWDALDARDWKPEASPDPDRITDPVVACLIYGTRLGSPLFLPLVEQVLNDEASSTERRWAAIYYLAHHPQRPPRSLAWLLVPCLGDSDAEIAGQAAVALARLEGGGMEEASKIAGAFLDGGPRIAQVDRLRALAASPHPPVATAVAAAFQDEDWMIRRTALEVLPQFFAERPAHDRQGLSAFTLAVADHDPEMDVRRAAVEALAQIAPKTFVARLARYRLGAPWTLRAAAARGLRHVPWDAVVRRWARIFLEDPDQRVRGALLETAKVVVEATGKLPLAGRVDRVTSIAELVSDDVVVEVGDLGSKLVVGPIAARLRGDPVQVALATQVVFAMLSDRLARAAFVYDIYAEEFLESVVPLIPDYEAELLQSPVDLAGAIATESATEILKAYLRSPEISIRQRAAPLLAARDEAADTFRPLSPEEQDALLRRCRGLARRTLSVKAPTIAILKTTRGDLRFRLDDHIAPATVASFIRLVSTGAYDGTLFQRVVPAFVAQGGCPRGDCWGGPGYSLPCEVSDRSYRRGTLGMAHAGKDTGGSQWFIAHRRVPRLDAGYTIFGALASGDDVLAALRPGDVILEVLLQ